MKRFLKILLKIIIVVVVITILFNVKIKNIKVEGNTKQPEEVLVSQIFKNDIEKISIIYFIKDRFFPHNNIIHVERYKTIWETPFSIRLQVYEKPDIGFIRKDIKKCYFDKDGVVSDISEENKSGIPEVRGINFNEMKEGKALKLDNKKTLDAILNISTKLNEYKIPLTLLDIDKNQEISVYVAEIEVKLGNINNMEVKLQRLKDIYPQISGLKGILDLSNASDNMLDERYIFKKTA